MDLINEYDRNECSVTQAGINLFIHIEKREAENVTLIAL